MPYLHLDLPGKFQTAQKRELAVRLCRLYADVMQTQTWRPNIGIAELGEDNLFHLGADGLEPIVMVLVEFRAGRPSEYRLKLADGIVDACVDVLKVPRKWVLASLRRMWVRRFIATENAGRRDIQGSRRRRLALSCAATVRPDFRATPQSPAHSRQPPRRDEASLQLARLRLLPQRRA
jgi:phenylpyruvate tautomerase PptA (4-oxalocrotonate tautomerase family)